MQTKIRPISEAEIDSVVHIHIEAFPDFFLTQLGERFLRIYYKSVMKNQDGILLGVFENDILYAFAAATHHSRNFHRNIIADNRMDYLLEGGRLLLTKPGALLRLYKNLTKQNPDKKDSGSYAELLSIGVCQSKQGLGYGRKILFCLEQIIKDHGGSRLSLTTDACDSNKAIDFYNSCGYEILYPFTAYPARDMYRFIKNITE